MLQRAFPLLLPLFLLAACGGDDGGSTDDAGASDVGPSIEVGPSDDASRVDVVVDERAPRAFRMAVGVPATSVESAFGTASWQFAAANADILTLRIDGGLPWAEILAGDAMPPEFEATLADLADRASQTGLDVALIIDPLAIDRASLAPDIAGRAVDGMETLGFDDAALRAGYTRFCEDLAARFTPRYLVPVVDINVYGVRRPEDFANLASLYESLREAVKFESPASLVFPIWNFAQVAETVRTSDVDQLAWFDELDEAGDLFAIDFRPALEGLAAGDLDSSDFDAIDRNINGAVTTRKIAVLDAGYPAAGVVQAGEVFASSENSQFNYLAFLFSVADRLDMEFVSWTAPVDPDAWLVDACGDDCPGAVAAYEALRQHGLVDSEGTERAARRLWEQYFGRVFVP